MIPRRQTTAFLPLAVALFCLAAGTAAAQRSASVEAATYEQCMGLARSNPAEGWEKALAWRGDGGGHPAEHCAALALIGLRQYAEAGKRLEKLAEAMIRAPRTLR